MFNPKFTKQVAGKILYPKLCLAPSLLGARLLINSCGVEHIDVLSIKENYRHVEVTEMASSCRRLYFWFLLIYARCVANCATLLKYAKNQLIHLLKSQKALKKTMLHSVKIRHILFYHKLTIVSDFFGFRLWIRNSIVRRNALWFASNNKNKNFLMSSNSFHKQLVSRKLS